ncbi:MAG: double-strand break repair helicase AddA [Dongiaceae bacterium]
MNAPSAAILKAAAAKQREAINPQASIWVAASAGTGKTTVLTNRVLYLLLSGTPPERVLCLTFTKAAAAEMANRIADRLEKWTSFDDQQLSDDILQLTGARPSSEARHKARQLFARVLDAPGGLKIQTIHAFCQALLKRFPLESGVAPHFEVLDERSSTELLHETREEILRQARGERDAPLRDALASVTGHVGEDDFSELLRLLAGERARLQELFSRLESVDAAIEAIRKHLAVGPDDSVDRLLRAACLDSVLDKDKLRRAAETLSHGSGPEAARGAQISAWLAGTAAERIAVIDDYAKTLLTNEGEVRRSLANKKSVAAFPAIIEVLGAEAVRLIALRQRMNAVTVAIATAALLRLADAMLSAYRRHKETRALLDYEDLVLEARNLLERPGIAPWVLYKLDGGLDHILIDEAQDTNPEQWEVVAALAGEFFVGEGAREERRTVFAVGDAKQSIYGFQRADPAAFKRMRDYFNDRVNEAREQFYSVALTISFRSADGILDAVNAVFKQANVQDGLLLDGAWPDHQAARVGQAGLVEMWPPVLPRATEELAPWSPPVERRAGDSPRGRLARLIASRIQNMIAAGDRLESRNRPVQPGDVLILVRRRDALVEELVRELKQRGIPVAGVDRMVLTEQLAVMDLMALGHFLLLPDDDLTLATVLKSPLVGFSEDDLYDLAEPRKAGLWQELRRRASDKAIFSEAHDLLSELLARADFQPPFELYGELLGRGGARRALLSRLGPEAADAIDEFFNLALAYQRGHAPSLQGFLQWLVTGEVEVKRDLDQESRGQVRIMTVHGAKGLQAPIVILPDTMQTPSPTARLLWSVVGKGSKLPLWVPRKEYDETRAAGAREMVRQADAGEQRRLLYVALTRAQDRLYICGWHGKQKPPEDCWYHLISKGLATIATPFEFDCMAELGVEGWQGTGYRHVTDQTAPPESKPEAPRGARPAPTALPPWCRAAPLPEPVRPQPLTPSRPAKDEPPVQSPVGKDAGERFRRGIIIHRLLQLLPDVESENRAAAGRRFLARPIHGLSGDEQAEIAQEALRVVGGADFAPLFGPGSRAEVPIAGEIATGRGSYIVSGQIDRLLVSDDAVLIVDYKSNRPPPLAESEVAEIYLRQMAVYRALLTRIYPDRPIRCALLWTDGPHLMPLSADLLDGYLP